MRRGVSPAPIQMAGGLYIDHTQPLVSGLVATDGVQYGAVATITNALTAGFQERLDFGLDMKTWLLELNLTARFTNVLTSLACSLSTYWQAKGKTATAWVNISPSINIPVGTQNGNTAELVFNGAISRLTISELPFDLRLAGLGTADGCIVQLKNNSTIRFVASVIP
jgi:hypothetical protein